ncbi:hypothetical protein TrRE_jg328 [Triparma retinervis]|uniref:Uncharacterized protein n=1 Tax=Triparma retinervis TaxID=2557542 RepID=A0A9W6ZB77_9STRA|nr:hypothetical protein TrRE_jg328 [Triparma retinervis]
MILFPCGADDSDRRGFDAFHNVTYHSVMAGPSLVSPVIKQLDVDGLPVWLLSYKVVIPGSYRLKVMVRFYNDFNQRSYVFFGESETRPCPGEFCKHRTNDGKDKDCAKESAIVDVDVVVDGGVGGEKTLGELGLGFFDLPLSQNGDGSPDGFWARVGRTTKDCMSSLQDINKAFEGNPCKLSGESIDGASPVYAWQPSDRRYNFYSSTEIGKCFEDRGIKKVLIQGDSQARSLFAPFPSLLGDLNLGSTFMDDLKQKFKDNDDGSGSTRMSNLGPNNLEVIYTQEWGENSDFADAKFKKEKLFEVGGPEVFIYNAGIPAHKAFGDSIDFQKWWIGKVSAPGAVVPKVLVFILPVTLQGQRNPYWSKMYNLQFVEKLERIAKNLGFSVLRLDQLTMGWDVTTTGQMDGFHYNFNAMSMGAMIVINTICNIPLKDYAEGRFYDVGEKLKVDSDSSDLLYTYEKKTVTIDGGWEADVLVPISDRYEKSRKGESWKVVNPCNCFDTERIVPYNLVEDPVSFDVFGVGDDNN